VLEDLDQLAGRQAENDASGGVYSRLVALLLMYLDGVNSNAGQMVLIATSQTKPENLDSRVIRPGRFDHLVEVPIPSKEDRRHVFNSIPKTTPHKIDEFLAITENWSIPEVKRRSLNYVQRDQIAFSPPLASRELVESLPARDMSAAGVEIPESTEDCGESDVQF